MVGEEENRRKDNYIREKGFWQGWSLTTIERFQLCQDLKEVIAGWERLFNYDY